MGKNFPVTLFAEGLTPQQLYEFDTERGREFSGPTPEEYLGWDELTIQKVDHMQEQEGWTADMVSKMVRLENEHRFLELTGSSQTSKLHRKILDSMRERGEMPWQQR